jgi:GT2 family glycosyltransferase
VVDLALKPKSSSTSDPLVTIVILSYARPQYLDEVLRSVTRQSYSNLEILLIDNRSPETARVAAVARNYPEVKFIPQSENLGFAEGMNAGVRLASGEYSFLTEDDMVLHPECIANFVRFATSYPDPAVFSGLQLNRRDRTVRYAGAKLELGRVFRFTVLRQGEEDKGTLNKPYETEYIPGNMVFGRTTTLRRTGPFRPEFFMYFEDTDFGIRLRRSGARLMVVPTAKAWHFEPLSEHCSDQIQFHKTKNFFAIYILHARASVLPEAILRYWLVPAILGLLRDAPQTHVLLRATVYILAHLHKLAHDRYRSWGPGVIEGL